MATLVQIDADTLSTLVEAAAAQAEHLGDLASEEQDDADAGDEDAAERLADYDGRCNATWAAVHAARALLAGSGGPVQSVLSRTDWTLLSQQKLALLKACEKDTALDGMLHFIDALQDAAEKEGHPVVFLTEGKG
jgi:biotin synthase-related radical SAM superfamily protein